MTRRCPPAGSPRRRSSGLDGALLALACGACSSSPPPATVASDRPSHAEPRAEKPPAHSECEDLFEHIVSIAENGAWRMPREQYEKENKERMVRQCASWTPEKRRCVGEMKDIGGDDWAKCAPESPPLPPGEGASAGECDKAFSHLGDLAEADGIPRGTYDAEDQKTNCVKRFTSAQAACVLRMRGLGSDDWKPCRRN